MSLCAVLSAAGLDSSCAKLTTSIRASTRTLKAGMLWSLWSAHTSSCRTCTFPTQEVSPTLISGRESSLGSGREPSGGCKQAMAFTSAAALRPRRPTWSCCELRSRMRIEMRCPSPRQGTWSFAAVHSSTRRALRRKQVRINDLQHDFCLSTMPQRNVQWQLIGFVLFSQE